MLVTLALLPGCGESGGSESTTTAEKAAPPQEKASAPKSSIPEAKGLQVGFDRGPGPEHAGLFMAEKLGYFRDAGIQVAFFWPIHPDRPVSYVVDRVVDLSISHEPEVVLAEKRDEPVLPFGSLVTKPTSSLIWLKRSQIDGIADLRGKTIAIAGLRFERAYLKAILAQAHLEPADVKIREVGYHLLPVLLNGRADAILGSWNIEGIELRFLGLDPVITSVTKLGIPPYEELVWITRPDQLERNPKLIRSFMKAVARGTAAAAEDPGQAARFLLAENQALDSKPTLAMVKATLPLLAKTSTRSGE